MRISPTLPLLFRLPGLRRYAAEISRLRSQLERATKRIHHFEEHEADRELGIHLVHEVIDRARQFDYYWYNAHKKIDLLQIETFGALADSVHRDRRTFLHVDRLYTLWQAVTALPASARAVAEIGAYKGGSAKFIAEAMRSRDRELPLYVCDTFQGHVAVDQTVDGRHKVGKQFTGVRAEEVAEYLRKFASVRLLKGDIRDTAASLEGERQFGLVHIDVDVYPVTQFCLEFFRPRVVAGATIVVDDYGFNTCAGVKRAVDEFSANNPEFRMLHLLTGQALLIRLSA